jgi:hypothetical protein
MYTIDDVTKCAECHSLLKAQNANAEIPVDRVPSFEYDCPKCLVKTTWTNKGTSATCNTCNLLGQNSKGPCNCCVGIDFLYYPPYYPIGMCAPCFKSMD